MLSIQTAVPHRWLASAAGAAIALSVLGAGALAAESPPPQQGSSTSESSPRQRSPEARPRRAQGRGEIGEGMLQRMRESVQGLKLSDEQQQKLDEIFKSAQEEMKTLRQEVADLEPRQRLEKMGSFFAALRQKVGSILDEEQKAALRERVEKLRPGPGGPGAGPGGGAGGAIAERLRQGLEQLELTDEQKGQIRDLFDDLKSKMQDLRQGVESGDRDARAKAGALLADMREQLDSILTPQQRDKLRDLMRGGPPGEGRPGDVRGERRFRGPPSGDRPTTRPRSDRSSARPTTGETMMSDTMMSSDKMEGDTMMSSAAGARAARPGDAARTASDSAGVPFATDSTAVRVGEPAPDFNLKRTDGQRLRLSAFKGRPIVLVFGSYSSPSFREHADDLNRLRDDLGTRAQLFVIYTREAHANGQWEVERNKNQEITVDQPADEKARLALADRARQSLKLGVPVAVDTMDDATAKAYGLYPNGAVVIARDGTVAFRQKWFDPYTLRGHIDDAVKRPAGGSAATQPE